MKKITRRLAAFALGTTLLFTAVSGVSADAKTVTTTQAVKKTTYTTTANLNLRGSNSTSAKKLLTIPKGKAVTYVSKSGNWYKVKYNGKTGWVSAQYVKVSTSTTKAASAAKTATTTKAASTAKKTYTTTAALNLRASNSTKSKVLLTIPKGKAVTYVSKSGNWYKVKYSGKTGWVSAQYIKVSTTTTKASTAKSTTTAKSTDIGTKIVKEANKYLGKPYKYGGTTPSGFDCSGFVYYVYNKAGKKMARSTAASYYYQSKKVSNPQVGDLVFFAGTYGSGISHVGIYIGNGKMIDASGTKVQINTITSGYWKKYLVGYGRL